MLARTNRCSARITQTFVNRWAILLRPPPGQYRVDAARLIRTSQMKTRACKATQHRIRSASVGHTEDSVDELATVAQHHWCRATFVAVGVAYEVRVNEESVDIAG